MFILIIIAVIFLLHNKGYCAQEDSQYSTDTTYFILEEYQNCVNDFVMAFDKYYNNEPTFTNNINNCFNMLQNGWYMYFDTTNAVLYPKIYMYKANYSQTLVDTSLVYNPSLRVPSTAYNITLVQGDTYFNFNRPNYWVGVGSVPSNNINIAVPQILLYKTNVEIIELMHRAGIGYFANENAIVDIKALLQEQNNKLDAINDSLTNSTYNEEVVEVDTSAIDDVSEQQITGLFTSVIGAFQNSLSNYGGTITKIIPLPHGGQIEIPSNIVSTHLGNLTALVEAFWYFVFGLYLFRFVSNLIHKIKTGDILNGYTNDNEIITSSML